MKISTIGAETAAPATKSNLFQLPKLADSRKPKFVIPNFEKICRRCGKGLPQNTDRPFADLICANCLQIWTEIEMILDQPARQRFNTKRAKKLQD